MDEVAAVECFGSGSKLGDGIEMNALSGAFGRRKGVMILTSGKTNIGHTESASGMAALCKVMFQFSRRRIPRHLHFLQLNEHIGEDTMASMNAVIPVGDDIEFVGICAVGVSAFGFSGVNAHCILSPVMQEGPNAIPTNEEFHISGKSERALRILESQFEEFFMLQGAVMTPVFRQSMEFQTKILSKGSQQLGGRQVLPKYPFKDVGESFWLRDRNVSAAPAAKELKSNKQVVYARSWTIKQLSGMVVPNVELKILGDQVWSEKLAVHEPRVIEGVESTVITVILLTNMKTRIDFVEGLRLLQTEAERNLVVVVTRMAFFVEDGDRGQINRFSSWICAHHNARKVKVIDVDTWDSSIVQEICDIEGPDRVVAIRRGLRLVPFPENVDAVAHVLQDWENYELKHDESFASLKLCPVKLEPVATGEVLVEVRASGLNFRDVMLVSGLVTGLTVSTEIGGEFSGVVHCSDEVFGISRKCFARYVHVDQRLMVLKPGNISHVEAASIPVVFSTALGCLRSYKALGEDSVVLIHAASGGVGLAAVQLAKNLFKVKKIIATAGAPRKQKLVISWGVDENYSSRKTGFSEEVSEQVDFVLNSITGNGFVEETLKVLKPNGFFAEIGKRGILEPREFRKTMPNAEYLIFDLEKEEPEVLQELLSHISSLLERRVIEPIPISSFPLVRAKEAFQYMFEARHIGKLVFVHPFAPSETSVAICGSGEKSSNLKELLCISLLKSGRCARLVVEEKFDSKELLLQSECPVFVKSNFVPSSNAELGGRSAITLHALTGEPREVTKRVVVRSPFTVVLNRMSQDQSVYRALHMSSSSWSCGALDAFVWNSPTCNVGVVSWKSIGELEKLWTHVMTSLQYGHTGLDEESLEDKHWVPVNVDDVLKKTITDLVGTDVVLEETTSFQSLGFNSLLALSFRNRMVEELRVSFPATIVFDHPTVGLLRDYLYQLIDSPTDTREAVATREYRRISESGKYDLFIFPPLGFGDLSFLQWGKRLPEFSCHFVGFSFSQGQGFEAELDRIASLIMSKASGSSVLYGHSLGGICAYQVALRLQAQFPFDLKLAVSSVASPSLFSSLKHMFPFASMSFEEDETTIDLLIEASMLPPMPLDPWQVVHRSVIVGDAYFIARQDLECSKIEVPTLVMHATDDVIASREAVWEWHSLCNSSMYRSEFQGNHFFFRNPPDSFFADLSDFASKKAGKEVTLDGHLSLRSFSHQNRMVFGNAPAGMMLCMGDRFAVHMWNPSVIGESGSIACLMGSSHYFGSFSRCANLVRQTVEGSLAGSLSWTLLVSEVSDPAEFHSLTNGSVSTWEKQDETKSQMPWLARTASNLFLRNLLDKPRGKVFGSWRVVSCSGFKECSGQVLFSETLMFSVQVYSERRGSSHSSFSNIGVPEEVISLSTEQFQKFRESYICLCGKFSLIEKGKVLEFQFYWASKSKNTSSSCKVDVDHLSENMELQFGDGTIIKLQKMKK